ncbi:hypothetical protein [Sulfurimonas sp.]
MKYTLMVLFFIFLGCSDKPSDNIQELAKTDIDELIKENSKMANSLSDFIANDEDNSLSEVMNKIREDKLQRCIDSIDVLDYRPIVYKMNRGKLDEININLLNKEVILELSPHNGFLYESRNDLYIKLNDMNNSTKHVCIKSIKIDIDK